MLVRCQVFQVDVLLLVFHALIRCIRFDVREFLIVFVLQFRAEQFNRRVEFLEVREVGSAAPLDELARVEFADARRVLRLFRVNVRVDHGIHFRLECTNRCNVLLQARFAFTQEVIVMRGRLRECLVYLFQEFIQFETVVTLVVPLYRQASRADQTLVFAKVIQTNYRWTLFRMP